MASLVGVRRKLDGVDVRKQRMEGPRSPTCVNLETLNESLVEVTWPGILGKKPLDSTHTQPDMEEAIKNSTLDN